MSRRWARPRTLFGAVASLVLSLACGALADAERPRKVAVTEFGGKEGKEIRLALLEVLSEQSDLEVLGHRDIDIVAKRLGADLDSASGRRTVAVELGIFAWFDAEPGDAGARVRVSNAKGRQLGQLQLQPGPAEQQASQVRETAWAQLGHHVSKRALRLHTLGQHKEAAGRKLEARQAELQTQREVAASREARRLERLAALKVAASEKLATRAEEGQRQVELAMARIEAENRAREDALAAERERQAEEARMLAARRQQQAQAAAMAKAQPAQAMPAYSAEGSPQPGRFGEGAWTSQASPATQRWLQNQPVQPAPAYAPQPYAQPYAPQPAYPAAQPTANAPVAGAECPATVSEATCAWLRSRREGQ